ncbi:hypothetical protein RB595_001916 [Gaeumannomyces hyphopodioides]
MWRLLTLVAVGSLVPTAWSGAVPSEPHLSTRQASDQQPLLPGGPHPNPTSAYWQMPPHRIADLRTTPDLPTSQTFDYVIIGSGVSGTTVAYKLLSRDPSLSILMLEARAAASGASGRNGGHVKAGDWKQVQKWTAAYGEDEALRIGRLEQESVDELRDFVRAHNITSGFAEVESADLYWTKEAFESAVKVVDVMNDLERRRPSDVPQNNTRRVYAGQAARDHWGWPEILGAITSRGSMHNPYLTVCAMLELALDKGLNLQTHTTALALNQMATGASGDGAKWEVQTDRGTVKGNKVVLATNGFTSALHKGFAGTKFLTPNRHQATAVHPEAYTTDKDVFQHSASYPDLHSGNEYITVRPPGTRGQGDLVIGGGKKFSPSRELNLTDDTVVNADIASHLAAVGRVAYGYRNWGETTEVLAHWTGICCDTPDGLPLVGGVPGEDGLWATVCMNGHGMAWASRSSEALVHMMTEGSAPEWFPKAFRSERAWE